LQTELTGTPNQIEWAVLIRASVGEEFDRVAKAFSERAGKQSEAARLETQAIIAIVHEKRAEVMANHQAGYFIRDWQELSGRVREIIARDPRYQAIKSNREARRG
jgi:hypothetical protein